jgi:hypothetical protein
VGQRYAIRNQRIEMISDSKMVSCVDKDDGYRMLAKSSPVSRRHAT